MRTSDVPRILRESPEVARAREEGQRAGRAGVAADQNPWFNEGSLQPFAVTARRGEFYHAAKEARRTYCGTDCITYQGFRFADSGSLICRRCVRAVEAERKRRATAWEEGRLSTHPK